MFSCSPDYVERLKEAGSIITHRKSDPNTENSLRGKENRGVEGARILLERQLEGVEKAAKAGMLVKVNSVMVPGINADHLPEVAKKMKDLGAYIVNILPLIPVPGTHFESRRAPTSKERKELQDMCEVDIRQMRHCRQCRADAIGLLDKDRSAEFAHFTCGGERARKGEPVGLEMEGQTIYRIAVATKEGRVVDLHFGHAEEFWTFTVEGRSITPGQKISVVEQQEIPLFGRPRTK